MSYVELIPTVRSLSRSDKLRLIQWLAGDLAETVEATLKPTDRNGEVAEEGNREVWNENLLRHPIPVRFPDESYEAAAILMKLLEAEKAKK